MVKSTCETCSKVVLKATPRRFCSKRCYGDHKRIDYIKTCIVCGVTFYRRPDEGLSPFKSRKYCGAECRFVSKGGSLRTCRVCSKDFYAPKSEVLRGISIYCSRACRHKSQREHQIQKVCEVCEKSFLYRKNVNERFCSLECKFSNEKKLTSTCRRCEKTYKYYRNTSEGKYCSMKCFREDYFGELTCRWLGGKSFEPYPPEFNQFLRRKIRELDGHYCQLCGLSEEDDGRKLSVHHIDYDKNNIQLHNLISLCRYCHIRTNFHRQHWPLLLKSILRSRRLD